MAGEQILVVDDSKYMVSFLADTALPALGYRPLVATTGQKGLELVSREKPDLILLDFNLPDMSGMDIVRHLASAGNRTPVILMTAYGSEQVAVEAFRLGVRDYLSKPVEMDEVADSIERALNEPRLRRDKRQLAEELHRTNMELRRQMEQVATMTQIGRAIASSLDFNRVLALVSDAAIRLCDAEESTIWLLEGKGDELVMVAEKGVDQEAIRMPRLRVHDTLAGEAIRQRRPVHRVAGRAGGVKIKTGYMVQAAMYVPILMHDTVLGVVSVANRTAPRTFEPQHQQGLQALTDYAAIAITNARLYQSTDSSLQKRLGELAAINDISEAVATLDLKLLFRRAMNRMHRTFDVEAAALFLADESQSALTFILSSDLTSNVTSSLKIPFGKGVVGTAVAKRTSLFSNDPYNNPDFMKAVDEVTGFSTRSLLAVPLLVKDRVLGAIELVNKRNGDFDEQDAHFLRSIAMPIAVAVDNASLFEQVSRERATLQAILGGSINPVLIVNSKGQALLGNPAFCRTFLVEPQRVPGRSVAELTRMPALVDMVKAGAAGAEEIEFDGMNYLANVSPVRQVGFVIELHDITHLKDLDKAKDDFVTAVSHDLRSPLTAVVGFIELLPKVGEFNEQQTRFLNGAMEAVQKMQRLVDDLLDLAKIESGMEKATAPCNLETIAQSIMGEFDMLAENKGIELSLDKQGEIPAVSGDPNQLQRALRNLVENAIKYTESGGQVRITLKSSVHNASMAVIDTGEGISKEDLARIFEPFYRSEQHQGVNGSGLGLTMVKSIVEAHGGSVSARSQLGDGTTFTVTLPAA